MSQRSLSQPHSSHVTGHRLEEPLRVVSTKRPVGHCSRGCSTRANSSSFLDYVSLRRLFHRLSIPPLRRAIIVSIANFTTSSSLFRISQRCRWYLLPKAFYARVVVRFYRNTLATGDSPRVSEGWCCLESCCEHFLLPTFLLWTICLQDLLCLFVPKHLGKLSIGITFSFPCTLQKTQNQMRTALDKIL